MAVRARHTTNTYNKSETLTDMYPEPDHPTYRLALTVDLNRCTGCGACEAACYAENNIPVVGPNEVYLGRRMGWIRMSRYWESKNGTATEMIHRRCSHRPLCVSTVLTRHVRVYSVFATYHNLDGLNAMVYNRCRYRYCANNCPYSARRFNFIHIAGQIHSI